MAPARSYSAFFASRSFDTREKSTSNTEWTCADVRRLAIMCSAILRRMIVIGTTSSPGLTTPVGAGPAAGCGAPAGAAGRLLDELEDVLLRHAAADARIPRCG